MESYNIEANTVGQMLDSVPEARCQLVNKIRKTTKAHLKEHTLFKSFAKDHKGTSSAKTAFWKFMLKNYRVLCDDPEEVRITIDTCSRRAAADFIVATG